MLQWDLDLGKQIYDSSTYGVSVETDTVVTVAADSTPACQDLNVDVIMSNHRNYWISNLGAWTFKFRIGSIQTGNISYFDFQNTQRLQRMIQKARVSHVISFCCI